MTDQYPMPFAVPRPLAGRSRVAGRHRIQIRRIVGPPRAIGPFRLHGTYLSYRCSRILAGVIEQKLVAVRPAPEKLQIFVDLQVLPGADRSVVFGQEDRSV